jgi:hypothetical protein
MTDTEARQQNALAETWSQIRVYLLLTVAISAVFRYCIVHTGRLGAGRGLYVTGLMWSPGLAGLIARYLWSAWTIRFFCLPTTTPARRRGSA